MSDEGVLDGRIELAGYGFRAALGGQYYINNFYLAPELVYHYATMTDGLQPDAGGARLL